MKIVLDSTTFALFINPDAHPPKDMATGKPLALARERVTGLIDQLDKAGGTLIVPTPVLAELLVRAGSSGPEFLERLNRFARIRLHAFDMRAAIEHAAMTQEAINRGNRKAGHSQPWQRIKFDRQIIAIAQVAGATQIYSDDGDLIAFAREAGMRVFTTQDLPVPEEQVDLFSVSDKIINAASDRDDSSG